MSGPFVGFEEIGKPIVIHTPKTAGTSVAHALQAVDTHNPYWARIAACVDSGVQGAVGRNSFWAFVWIFALHCMVPDRQGCFD